MTNTPEAQEFQAKLQRLELLLQESERAADPVGRGRLREVVRSLLDLHAAGLERLLDHVADAGQANILDRCAADDVVGGLLLLHGLHPWGTEDRVRQALDDVQPVLRSHGVAVDLLGIEDGVMRLQLDGGCDGCASSAAAIRRAVEEAIYARAPDVAAVEIEGLGATAANGATRVPLPVL